MSPPVSAEIKNVHKGNSFKEEEDSFTFKGFMFRTCIYSVLLVVSVVKTSASGHILLGIPAQSALKVLKL